MMSEKDQLSDMMAKLIQGDGSALTYLYNRYANRVFNLAFQIVKDSGWSQDIVQEVFIKIWDKREELDKDSNIWVLLYVMTKRYAINKLKAINRRSYSFDRLYQNIELLDLEAQDLLIYKELEGSIQLAIEKLTPKQKEIFNLSRVEGLSHQKIADRLGISIHTVKNHMVEALKTLRKVFKNSPYFLSYLIVFQSFLGD